MGEESVSRTAALSEVNPNILGAARELSSEELKWEFFCECGRADCRERVILSLDAYVGLHAAGRAVLSPGHQLSQVGRARRLVEDAEALRGQARHQVIRARENLRHPAEH